MYKNAVENMIQKGVSTSSEEEGENVIIPVNTSDKMEVDSDEVD